MASGTLYGTIDQILSTITQKHLDNFSEENSDLGRINHILNSTDARETFQVKSVFQPKVATEASNLKLCGNKAYGKNDFKTALRFYTGSILFAPVPLPNYSGDKKSNQLPIALANRSACLFQMEKYDLCLRDINLAFRYNYPKELYYKLHERKAKCLLKLNKVKDAVASFNEARDNVSLSSMKGNNLESWKASIQRQIDLCQEYLGSKQFSERPKDIENDDEIPIITGDENKKYSCASDVLSVEFSLDRGRYGIATGDVNISDVIMVQKPYAFVLGSEFYSSHCYHCFKPIEAPVACEQCRTVRFCSSDCKDLSWNTYHKTECPYLGLMQSSGIGKIGQLALRTLLVTPMDQWLKYKVPEDAEQYEDTMQDNQNAKNDFEALMSLVAHANQRSPKELLQFGLLAIFLAKILVVSLKKQDTTCDDKTEEYFLPAATFMLRVLQIITCNGIEPSKTLVDDNGTTETVDIGLALYPTVSLLNHSCNPSTEMIFYDNYCSVQAIQPMQSGDEITVDYGYVYYLNAKEDRQKSLEDQYYFTCDCEACSCEWPLKANLTHTMPSLKCEKCRRPLDMTTGVVGGDPTKVVCVNMKCNHLQDLGAIMQQMKEPNEEFLKALEEVKKLNLMDAVPVLEKYLGLLNKYFCAPFKEYVTCLSTLKRCYRLLGNSEHTETPEAEVD